MRRVLRYIFHPESLIMIGAATIFCSWIAQNFFENKYRMQREELERAKNHINELVIYSSAYEADTLRSDKDSARIGLSKRNYLQSMKDLYDITSNFWNDPTGDVIELKGKMDVLNPITLYKDGLYNELISRSLSVKKEKEEHQYDIIKGYYKTYQEICTKEVKANWTFVGLYAFGAICSGAGIFLRKRKEIIKEIDS